jgi:hypothetical protein
MGRVKEHSGFRSGLQQLVALDRQGQYGFAGWRLWPTGVGFLGRAPSPGARLADLSWQGLDKLDKIGKIGLLKLLSG